MQASTLLEESGPYPSTPTGTLVPSSATHHTVTVQVLKWLGTLFYTVDEGLVGAVNNSRNQVAWG